MPAEPGALGYSEDGDVVTLRMTRDDYSTVLTALGFRAGRLMREDLPDPLHHLFAATNRINAGNPRFTPYEIHEKRTNASAFLREPTEQEP
jgi:hypothetical protein